MKYLVYAAFIIFSFYIIDWGFIRGDITAYTVECKHPVNISTNYKCNNPEYTLRYTRYKVNVKRQEVVGWIEGFDPTRYKDCAIRNRRNWTCTYNDGSGTFGFNGGNYFDYGLKESTTDKLWEKMYTVSRIEYLKLQWFPEIDK